MRDFNLGTLDILSIVGYFSLVLIIGIASFFRQNKNTVHGFFLAGRRMSWLPVGASLFASNIGSEHFIGLSGTGAATGIGVGAFELNALILLQLLGFIFLPVYIASKVCTLPEYMKKRYGGERIRVLLAILSLILYILTKISVNLFSGALFIQQSLGWNLYASTLALLLLTGVCTLGGGLAAVIYIDVVQVVIMIAGSSALLYIGLDKVGGWEQLLSKYLQAIPSQLYINPNDNSTCGVPGYDSWQILRSPSSNDMPWPGFIFGQTPASIWYWCADQMMVQKALSSRSISDAQGATILTGWIKILPLFLIIIPGMISRVLYPDEIGCVDPEVCLKVCQNPVSCSNIAFPRLVLGIMPRGLRGLMVSVMLAALMSDLTTIFNSASTLFTMDIYRSKRKEAKTKELLLVGRICILALIVISILWIPIIQELQGGQLFIYIQSISAYLSPPIAVVFSLSICWKQMNESGAFWGLVYGLFIGIIRMIGDFIFTAPFCMEEDQRPMLIGKVHYMYFAAISFFSTGFVAILLSYCTPPSEPYRLIRTTFNTRLSKEPRPDEENKEDSQQHGAQSKIPLNTELKLELLEEGYQCKERENGDDDDTILCTPLSSNFKDYIVRGGESMECEESPAKIYDLTQTKSQKVILYMNLCLVIGGSLSLYTYFSINPFSREEIVELQSSVIKNSTIHLNVDC